MLAIATTAAAPISTNIPMRPIFIEAFVKGPEDKPMKPDTLKLFVAKR